MVRINKNFFDKDADIVAKELLGKILEVNGKKARIVETEAYLDENDPASRASKGDNKVKRMMLQEPGKILVYNVHMYKMLNFVANKKGRANAVLIRAVEPIDFKERCNGPGLLTMSLGIDDRFHGKSIGEDICLSDDSHCFDIIESFRIGVTKDLDIPLRFYIKDNKHVSKK